MSNDKKKLIVIGDWSLNVLSAEARSGICHTPCNSWMYRSAHRRKCIRDMCGERIPDDIYGVWLLHNFDAVQGGLSG
jgi:hypothetical protein